VYFANDVFTLIIIFKVCVIYVFTLASKDPNGQNLEVKNNFENTDE